MLPPWMLLPPLPPLPPPISSTCCCCCRCREPRLSVFGCCCCCFACCCCCCCCFGGTGGRGTAEFSACKTIKLLLLYGSFFGEAEVHNIPDDSLRSKGLRSPGEAWGGTLSFASGATAAAAAAAAAAEISFWKTVAAAAWSHCPHLHLTSSVSACCCCSCCYHCRRQLPPRAELPLRGRPPRTPSPLAGWHL